MKHTIGIVAALIASFAALDSSSAAILTYDAASGLFPEDVGWTYSTTPPAPTVTVGAGILTLDSPTLVGRGSWDAIVPATLGDDGGFIETTVRVSSESHTGSGRGLGIGGLAHGNGLIVSQVNLYAWTDRIFVNDINDIVVATYFMDTTDAFHAYRVELLYDDFWVFVDNSLVLHGTTPTVPFAANGVQGGFGDGTVFSGGRSEWTEVNLGSLADIGGPTVPEPSSLALLGVGVVILGAQRRRRRLRA